MDCFLSLCSLQVPEIDNNWTLFGAMVVATAATGRTM